MLISVAWLTAARPGSPLCRAHADETTSFATKGTWLHLAAAFLIS